VPDDIDQIASRAAAAAGPYAALDPAIRARALVAAADALNEHADELIELAMAETGLTRPRLTGELKRTAVQLKLFADVVADGSYLDVRVDDRDPDFAIGPRPELRRTQVPLGPVLNFAAGNFPFAFSVAGGDTAAALAAGCPVIVKAHPGHPELSRRTAAIVADALESAGLPADVLQLVEGQEAGAELLQHRLIKAGSFTGSTRAGRLLADLAAARPAPIPFFGELGSVNPVFVTPAAVAARGPAIASAFVTSVAGSAGQLCTKPGLVFVPVDHGLEAPVGASAADVAEHRLLDPRIAANYRDGRARILATPGVRVIAEGALRFDDDGQGWATPTIVAADLETVRSSAGLREECFGPLSILVEYPDDADLSGVVEELFEGNLTSTLQLADGESSDELRALVQTLATRAGRVIVNGWPTGVAVTPAMEHGGPWPATTSGGTSVGTAAISRFLRGVAYQDLPESLLPAPVRAANPWHVPQTRAAAGESTSWGSLANA